MTWFGLRRLAKDVLHPYKRKETEEGRKHGFLAIASVVNILDANGVMAYAPSLRRGHEKASDSLFTSCN